MLGLLRSDRHASAGSNTRARSRGARLPRLGGSRQALERRAVRFSNSSRRYLSRRLIRCAVSIVGCMPVRGSVIGWCTAIGLALVAPGCGARDDTASGIDRFIRVVRRRAASHRRRSLVQSAVHGQQGCGRRWRCGLAALRRCISPPGTPSHCGTSRASGVWQVAGVCLVAGTMEGRPSTRLAIAGRSPRRTQKFRYRRYIWLQRRCVSRRQLAL